MTKKLSSKSLKWALLCLGTASVLSSLFLVTVGAIPRAEAMCGSDSYVGCRGGVTCTATDNVGCRCVDARGRVVSRHSCREASQDRPGEEDIQEEDDGGVDG